METQYTPGPWRLDNDELRSGVFSDNENYHGIEAGDGYLKDGQGFNCTGYMTKADALLMVAAPDMLDALEGVHSFLVSQHEELLGAYKRSAHWEMDYGVINDFKAEIEDLEVVIRKAKGKPSEPVSIAAE